MKGFLSLNEPRRLHLDFFEFWTFFHIQVGILGCDIVDFTSQNNISPEWLKGELASINTPEESI
jgi:hypothetical protein